MPEDTDTATDTRTHGSRAADRDIATDRLGFDRDPTSGRFVSGNRLTFAAGNVAARTTGIRAFKDRGAAALPPAFREELEAFRAGVEADRGGPSELTTIGAGHARRLTEIEAIVRLLAADLEVRGLLTQRGRVQSTCLALLQAVDRWDRLAQRLGLERRSKRVPTPDEVLRGDA